MRSFLFGAVLALLVVGGLFYWYLGSGLFAVGASTPPDVVDRLAPWALDRSVARAAAGITVAIPQDAESQKRGMSHYVENCLPCHSGPGAKPAEFAEGLNPAAPALDSAEAQAMSDKELFWIVKNGIRMTAMPAFGVNHKDPEILDIVAFVRHLPKLDAAEKEALAGHGAAEEHHHEHGGGSAEEPEHGHEEHTHEH